MDESTLTQWRLQLEAELSDTEKKISVLELDRKKIAEQLGAVIKLLSTMKVGMTTEMPSLKNQSAAEATTGFVSGLKLLGWSVDHIPGRAKIYQASRGNLKSEIWLHFSACHEATGKYWFGISPEGLENRINLKGGVVLILGAADHYLCFPFVKLLEFLNGASKTKTGYQEFQILEKSGVFSIQPGGMDWIDVTSFYNDLSKIGVV